MFDKIKRLISGVRYRMFPIQTIAQALDIDLATDTTMANAISRWVAMYKGYPAWVSDKDDISANSGVARAIASELARLATIECKVNIGSGARATYLSKQWDIVLRNLREQVEFGVSQGGLIFKPYLSNGRIAVDFSHATAFVPESYDSSGRLSAVVFVDEITEGRDVYRRLERHHLEPNGCVIENKAYVTTTTNPSVLGEPISLKSVPQWAALEPMATINNVDRLLLGYFRMPGANNVVEGSPLGVSIYSGAESLIRDADRQWGRILWEYEGTELAIHADPTLFHSNKRGEFDLPKGKERLYRIIPGLDNDTKMEAFSPAIRDVSLFNGLDNILRRIEFACGLAYGTLSNPQNVDKTAEEIKASKQRSFATVRDIQLALQESLDDLFYAIDKWVSLAGLAPEGAYKISYEWDDSIVNDPDKRQQRYWQYVQTGKFPFWKYLVDIEGFAEDEAKLLAEENRQSMENPFGYQDNGGT